MKHAIIGNTFTSTTEFLSQLLERAAEIGSKEGVKQYKIEQLKDTVVSTKNAADYLDCTTPTIINYINEGHKTAGKLTALTTGKRYKINKYDLEVFKSKMTSE